MSRPHLELADVFAALGSGFLKTDTQLLSSEQRQAFQDIIQCRTAALGGHVHFAGDAANRIAYTSHGAISKMKLGNGLWEHTDFNSRLQPTQIGLGTAGSGFGSTSVLGLDYTYGVMAGAVLRDKEQR